MTIEELKEIIVALKKAKADKYVRKFENLLLCAEKMERSSLDLKITKPWNPPIIGSEL